MAVNAELPPELDRIVGKALEKDRDVRYQTASDLRADLERPNFRTITPFVTGDSTTPRGERLGSYAFATLCPTQIEVPSIPTSPLSIDVVNSASS